MRGVVVLTNRAESGTWYVMYILYNAPEMKERRRKLRQNMTYTEKCLWERLRGRRFQDLRFLRQYSVQEFILDFYCPELRLAIEVDGTSHLGEGRARDEERDDVIKAHNIAILRLWNHEVLDDIDQALAKISSACIRPDASLDHKGGWEGS